MNEQEWIDESSRRIKLSESCRLYKYRDELGVITLGWGWNYERSDTQAALLKVGANWPLVSGSPIAPDATADFELPAIITQHQADSLFTVAFSPIIAEARASLNGLGGMMTFDRLSDARRYVVTDLRYQLGLDGWMDFLPTRTLIVQAQIAKDAGNATLAHSLFNQVCDHLIASAWYSQSGNRGKRNVAMMRDGGWRDPNGDGSS